MMRSIFNNILIRQKENSVLLRYMSTNKLTRKLSNSTTISPNVTGLSEKCLKVPNTPVGPGASKDKEYKNPEYFCYNIDTFGEAEVEIAKYRLPAPSNKVPFQR